MHVMCACNFSIAHFNILCVLVTNITFFKQISKLVLNCNMSLTATLDIHPDRGNLPRNIKIYKFMIWINYLWFIFYKQVQSAA